MLKPIALQSEYLPPTQSQNSKIFSSAIPNALTAPILVDKATKCFATSSSLPAFKNQDLAEFALVMVS